jgi:bacillopeptidase F
LTALARDAAGNQATSSPVTVTVSNQSPPPPPPPSGSGRRYEETDSAVSYSAGWVQRDPYDWSAWSGGTAMMSSVPGARATFSFSGDSVTWIGYRSLDSGIARVYVDGRYLTDLDLFQLSDESATRVYSVRRLAPGNHTLGIEVTGTQNSASQGNSIVIDAFDVPAPVVSHLQDSDPDVAYTGSWTHEDGWTQDASMPWSGRSATYTNAAGASATLAFHGTAIGWVGYRGPLGGIARVYLDGVDAGQVDTYFYATRLQSTLFTRSGLADTNHTLRIEVTGTRNSAASNADVIVDAFDVTAPGTRFEEKDTAISYSGSWTYGNRNRPWSEGFANTSYDPGARATFTFNGTAVSWIGCAKATTGIARVYLDGVFVREIDTYFPWPIEGYQRTLFKATGLAQGPHTLVIEATGRKNPSASSAYVVVDAFDVQP